ncbi:MAG: thiol-disulfide oxidoreductase DCC family protein [Nitrospiria bacterium]
MRGCGITRPNSISPPKSPATSARGRASDLLETPPEVDPEAGGSAPLVLFDGVCGLCTRTVRFVIHRDPRRRFRFAALQSPLGRRVLERAGLPVEEFATFVLLDETGLHTRSTAALRVARRLSGPWRLLAVGLLIPKPIRDVVYDWVARRRYRLFGRLEACPIPPPEIRDRFVE